VRQMPVDLITAVEPGTDESDPDNTIVMQAWDFAGQQMYYSMVHVFLTSRAIYVLVLDLSRWAMECSGPVSDEIVDSVDFWLAAIIVHAPESHLVIVGTHDDALTESNRRRVHERVNSHLAQHLEKVPSLQERLCVNDDENLLFFPIDNSRTSVPAQESVDRLRSKINGHAQEAVRQWGTIPTSYAQFFNMLTTESSGQPCTSFAECRKLASRLKFQSGEGDLELQACLSHFHDMGQLLFFRGTHEDVDVVLDCQWLLNAMARVVACPRVLQRHPRETRALHEKGELTTELLKVLWDHPSFTGRAKLLQDYLEHFDLIVPSPGGRWFVPSMLPWRCSTGCSGNVRVSSRRDESVFVIDFHCALRQLLTTLLPRLLCHLHTRHPSDGLRVKGDIFRDFVQFWYAEGILVTLSLVPYKSQKVLQVGIEVFNGLDALTASQQVLDAIRQALLAWLPHLAFEITVPCPQCCSADGVATHLVCLNEVLEEPVLLCEHTHVQIQFPESILLWRGEVRARKSEIPEEKVNVEKPQEASGRHLRVDFFYASPLYAKRRDRALVPMPELMVRGEAQSLQEIPLLDLRVQLASRENLHRSMQHSAGPRVIHLSAHGIPAPLHGHAPVFLEDRQPGIFLEPSSKDASEADAAAADAISADDFVEKIMAGFEASQGDGLLLVLFFCGSDKVLARIMNRYPHLRCAVCCREDVFDGAVRVFCRRFYFALSEGKTVFQAHQSAQQALKASNLKQGFSAEAEKFLLVHNRGLDASAAKFRVTRDGRLEKETALAWPRWPAVEDFIWDPSTVRLVMETFKNATSGHDRNARRVVSLIGPPGVGKTSLCRELSRHVSAPGRVFERRVFMVEGSALRRSARSEAGAGAKTFTEDFKAAILSEIALRDRSAHLRARDERGSGEDFWRCLATELDERHAGQPMLLIVDAVLDAGDAQELRQVLGCLLKTAASLCLILTAETSSSGLGGWIDGDVKVVDIPMQKLPVELAVYLFLRRIRRALYLYDFVPHAPPPPLGATGGPALASASSAPAAESKCKLELKDAKQHLMASQLMHDLECLPGKVVEAAVKVDETLATLRNHPMLNNREAVHVQMCPWR